jgi:hypothetical protein
MSRRVGERENRVNVGAVPGSQTMPPLPAKRIKTRSANPSKRTFDRRTGELNGSFSGSAQFTLLLTDYGKRSIFPANRPY